MVKRQIHENCALYQFLFPNHITCKLLCTTTGVDITTIQCIIVHKAIISVAAYSKVDINNGVSYGDPK